MKYLFVSILLLLVPCLTFGQTDTIKKKATLYDIVRNGSWEFHSRSVFMATVNDGAPKDDWALGTGLYAGLTTKSFHGFQFGMGGSFLFNIASSKLAEPDPVSQNINRYELGLFDVENPNRRSDLNKLEKLFIRYSFSKSSIEFGRIGLTTPFINAQDGRLRPTAQQGLWVSSKEIKNLTVSAGFINAFSPRSVVKWQTVGESFGLYPSGLANDGTRSTYKDNIKTEGVGLANIIYQPNKNIRINVWDHYIENVLNVASIEINHELQSKNKRRTFYQSLMFVREDAVNDGGNPDPKKTYIQKGAQANVISGQLGIRSSRINTSLNYTRITKSGRFLMPREWGRDPFYTFMPRERNEGAGDVHAIMVRSAYSSASKLFRGSLSYGYFSMPDVKNFPLNKYAQPSYHQFNIESGYSCKGVLKGFEVRALIAWKINADELYNNPRNEYNKVNMANFNFIVDYRL